MVRIRFRRVGAKNQPSFRIVAADRESPRDGRFLEVLGSYNPRTEPSTVRVDEARLFHWMSNGAQPSDAVVQTLTSVGTWDRWERYKQGESLEKLVSEAEAAAVEVDPRTRRDDLTGKRSKKKRSGKKAEAVPEGEPEAKEPVEDDTAAAESTELEAEGEAEGGESPTAEAEEPSEEGADEPVETEAEDAQADEPAEAKPDEGN